MKDPVKQTHKPVEAGTPTSLPKLRSQFAVQHSFADDTTSIPAASAAAPLPVPPGHTRVLRPSGRKRESAAPPNPPQEDRLPHDVMMVAYHEAESRNLLLSAEKTNRLILVDNFEEGPGSYPFAKAPTPPAPPASALSPTAVRYQQFLSQQPNNANNLTNNNKGSPVYVPTPPKTESPLALAAAPPPRVYSPMSAARPTSAGTGSTTPSSASRMSSPLIPSRGEPALQQPAQPMTLATVERREGARRRALELSEEDGFRHIRQALEECAAMIRIAEEDEQRSGLAGVEAFARNRMEEQWAKEWAACVAAAFPEIEPLSQLVYEQYEAAMQQLLVDEDTQWGDLIFQIRNFMQSIFQEERSVMCQLEEEYRQSMEIMEDSDWLALQVATTAEVQTTAVCCIQRSWRCFAARKERKTRGIDSVIYDQIDNRNDIMEEERDRRILIAYEYKAELGKLTHYKAGQTLSIVESAEWADRAMIMREASAGALKIAEEKMMEYALMGTLYIRTLIDKREIDERVELAALTWTVTYEMMWRDGLRRHAALSLNNMGDESTTPMLDLMCTVHKERGGGQLKWLELLQRI
eukprot:TRINITY_DN60901_c0_g1_i1.p1 TRINITY_DN60901_c0_g1~~TRINITY_DN60901_c0_g1_i1.p1  ORF type:complete len:601 (-),score=45.00 TRINITY_DN60901_c0_g1_i1:1429-3168(-)